MMPQGQGRQQRPAAPPQQQDRSTDSSGNPGRQGPAWGAPAQQQGQPPTGATQGGAAAPRPAAAPPMAPQSNARMGGVMGTPAQAQPWAQATQQQAQNQPRNYYGESAVEPSQPAQQPTSGEAFGASPSYDWQQQAQVPQAPQPIQANQLGVAPGMAAQRQRVPQQRSYYGE